MRKNLENQIDNLKGIVFTSQDYLTLDLPQNSIVYCDPPYQNTTKYTYKFNHEVFWNWVRKISQDHEVFVSEYAAPDDFEMIWQKEIKNSLSENGKSGGFKFSTEKLFKLK